MALTKEEIKTAYPLPVYNYKVEIDGVSVAFSEVSGLNITCETVAYSESPTENGAPGPKWMIMPAQRASTVIKLKKGLVRSKSISLLYNWINSKQLNQIQKKDIIVRLCDEEGDPVISWKVINAFPIRLDGPSFDASANDVAVESMELMADSIMIEEA